jgi:flagellin
VTVEVIQSAQHAQLDFRTSAIASDVTIEVAGTEGVTTLPFLAGTTASAIAAAINLVSDATGVSATLFNPANAASGITLNSIGFGSDAFVQIAEIGPTPNVFTTVDVLGQTVKRDAGRDAAATVNGASALGKGLNIFLNTTGLGLELRLQEAFNTLSSTSFAITGGGATFQLGPGVDSNQQVNIGVQSTAASGLGNATIGFLTDIGSGGPYSLVNGQSARAGKIISEAIRQISILRGRLGAFEKNTVDTNINQLQITLENLTSAESTIRDLDFAKETSNLTRSQILVSAGTSILALANQTPQSVLALLQ